MTLADFLLARITEDEAAARRDEPYQDEIVEVGEGLWLPSRVLAECEAKRQIIDMALRGPSAWTTYSADWGAALDGVLCWLALPYASHPDYRDVWRL